MFRDDDSLVYFIRLGAFGLRAVNLPIPNTSTVTPTILDPITAILLAQSIIELLL